MSILSKVKSVAKKVVTGVGAALKKTVGAVKNTLSKNAMSSNVASLGSLFSKPSQASQGGLDYSPNVTSNITGVKTFGQGDSGNNMSSKSVAGMTKYTPSYMTAAPKTVSSGKLSSKSNYSSLSYGTDLAALSASNFMTGGPISTSVSASSLSSQSSPTGVAGTIPSAPSRINYQGTAVGGNVGVGANPENGLIPTSSATSTGTEAEGQAPKEDATSMYQKAMEKLFKQKDSQDELYSKAMDESGIQQARQQMQNTQNSINAITSKMNSDLLQLRGTAAQEGVTEAVYGGQQAQITREATIQLLPLQAQLAADQGNLEMAESNLDTLFKIYSKDAEDSFDFYANQAKLYYEKATETEKRQLDANVEKMKYEQGITDDWMKWQRDMMSKSMTENPRLYNALKQIIPPTNGTSPTYRQDQQNFIADLTEAGGQYGAVAPKTGGGVLASLPISIQNRVIGLADDLKSSDIVKKFNSTADSINVVNGIDANSKNPADHQQIVYAFAKALDPDSAVREGEYATIKKYAQGAVSRYGKEISNAINGTGFLSAEAIKNIQATMNSTYNSRKPLYDNLIKEKSRIINNIAGTDVASELIINYAGGVSGGDENNDPLGIL